MRQARQHGHDGVLDLEPRSGSPLPTWHVVTSSLVPVEQSVLHFVSPTGTTVGGGYLLGPGTTVTATAGRPLSLTVVMTRSSPTTLIALSVSDWLLGQLENPGQALLGDIKTCATGTAQIASGSSDLEDVFRTTVGTLPACKSLLRSFQDLEPRATETDAVTDVAKDGDRFGGLGDLIDLIDHIDFFPR